jgi:phage terminase large subunit GpA-like protein
VPKKRTRQRPGRRNRSTRWSARRRHCTAHRQEPEDNNQKVKRFPAAVSTSFGRRHRPSLSSRPPRSSAFDEKAALQAHKEGDPVKLGQARQKTYDGEELTIFNSTPRRCDCATTGDDLRRYHARLRTRRPATVYVPCPHCEEFQTLKFGGKDCFRP